MKKRVLKTPSKRKPKEFFEYVDVVQQISDSTGFVKAGVKEVLDEFFRLARIAILSKKQVKIQNIGLIYPVVFPEKLTQKLSPHTKKAESMIMPARWVLSFKPANNMKRDLIEKEVTKEDLDNIYE